MIEPRMNISRRFSWPVLLLVAFGIFVYAPQLFFGKAFYGEEQYGFYYVISHYVEESLRAGTSLSWNNAYYGGVSATFDQFVGGYYPLNLALFSVFDFFVAHHLSITIATIAALTLSYWFGRLQDWHWASSLALALGYFSATTYMWIQIGTTAAHSFAALPGMLVAVHYTSRAKGWRYVLAVLMGGVALGVGFLAGFVQIVFYAYVIAGAYALFCDWKKFARGAAWYKVVSTSIAFAGMTIIGLLVGLRQLLPSIVLIQDSIRASSYASQHVTYTNPTELIAFFLPPYFSIPFFGGGGAAGFFVGATGLVCAVLALWYYRNPTTLLFAGMYFLIMGFAFHLPVLGWINDHVPPFSRMGGNFRWSVAAAFPLAYLAAAGVDGFLRDPFRVTAKFRRLLVLGGSLIVALLIAGGIVVQVIASSVGSSTDRLVQLVTWYTGGRELHYPIQHYVSILSNTIADVSRQFSLTNPRYLFGILLWVGTIAFFALYWRFAVLRLRAPIIAIVLFVTAAGGAAILQWSDLVPQSLYKVEPLLAAIVREREPDPHTYRIMGYVIGDGVFAELAGKPPLTPVQNTIMQRESLANNSNMFWDIERMDGMEPYRTLRSNRLLDTVIGHTSLVYAFDDASPALISSSLDVLYNRDVQQAVSPEEKVADLGKRLSLLSMMNVKYVFSPLPLAVTGLMPIETVHLSPLQDTTVNLYVYENTGALPRTYFAESQTFVSGERDAFLKVIAIQNFSKETVIECTDCESATGRNGGINVRTYENGRIELEVYSQDDRWLVFSESLIPGWKAYVDGQEVPIYFANYIFQAVRVPAGEHRVRFEYKDRFTIMDLFRSL